MIMRLISELCNRMLGILSFRNWGLNTQVYCIHISKGVRMYIHYVRQRKAIILSVIISGSTESVLNGMELR